MKYTIILILIMSFAAGSCSKEWLNDVEPQGKLLEVNYYQTEDEIQSGLTAIYSMFKNQYWQGAWSSWYLYASIPSDDAVCHGGGRADMPQLWEVDEFRSNSLTAGLDRLWSRPYFGIYRANVLIDRVDVTASESNKWAVAEAKMLRAYFYFELVRNFGEVPVFDHVLTPDEYYQEKASKQVVFEQIVKDLTEAAADLPKRWSGPDAYRMTKYAAHGLLGKVYVYMASPYYNLGTNYYELAKTELKKVIDEGGYELEPNFNDVWWYENEFNNETLIEMSYLYSTGSFWSDGSDGESNVVQQLQGPRGINANDTLTAGWGFDMITQSLVDEFRLQGDSVRLHSTVLAEWQMMEWGITDFEKNEAYTGYYNYKRATWSALNPTAGFWGWGNNERILRLSDIFLLYAEALNQTGDDATARSYVDMVRSRAKLGSITEVEAGQGISLYEAIKIERRLELAQEANRFFDLVRWGDAPAVLGHLGFVKGKSEHFAIPNAEIDKSNGVLVQNPAY